MDRKHTAARAPSARRPRTSAVGQSRRSGLWRESPATSRESGARQRGPFTRLTQIACSQFSGGRCLTSARALSNERPAIRPHIVAHLGPLAPAGAAERLTDLNGRGVPDAHRRQREGLLLDAGARQLYALQRVRAAFSHASFWVA